MSYKVIRFSQRGCKRTIKSGITLEEAVRICNDPKTSSQTNHSAKAKALTKRIGKWFYGYTKE